MNGIIVVDKPMDWTSQDVITKIKHLLKLKKVGHVGTLDPIATGVLVVLVNEATKLSDYLMSDNKEYLCEIVIGKSTDTEDVTGKIIETKNVEILENVDEVLESLKGDLKQVPPMYSSIHHDGVKLYELARQGKTVERSARDVHIYDIKRCSEITYADGIAKFSFIAKVSKGTYLRTLCVEIGNRLNFPAYMNGLRRLKSGNYTIENSFTLTDIVKGNYQVQSMLSAFTDKKIIEVTDELERRIKNGMKVSLECLDEIIIFTKNKELLAIYEKENNNYKAKRVWI